MTEFDSGVPAALVDHLRTHSLFTDGPYTLRSGAVSSWYIDARRTTYSGVGGRAVGDAVLGALDPDVTAVGGMTMGADPIAIATAVCAVSAGRAIDSFSIRKEAKGHGMGGRIVGPVSDGAVVAIVDDTVTTGGALTEAIDVVRDAGITVRQVLTLVDRSGGAVADRIAALGIGYRALIPVTALGVDV